ncbi:MAG: hypothetical protein JJE47_10070 [Acidimicrobiia bacterium]|nr:hypothetical protein [Acidimicrobiia bacterium]
MDDLVKIALYLSDTEAEIARAKLESGGMEAFVFVENLGGEGPRQGRLMVRPADVAEACEVLELDRPATRMNPLVDKSVVIIGLVLLIAAVAGFIYFLADGLWQ